MFISRFESTHKIEESLKGNSTTTKKERCQRSTGCSSDNDEDEDTRES